MEGEHGERWRESMTRDGGGASQEMEGEHDKRWRESMTRDGGEHDERSGKGRTQRVGENCL